ATTRRHTGHCHEQARDSADDEVRTVGPRPGEGLARTMSPPWSPCDGLDPILFGIRGFRNSTALIMSKRRPNRINLERQNRDRAGRATVLDVSDRLAIARRP